MSNNHKYHPRNDALTDEYFSKEKPIHAKFLKNFLVNQCSDDCNVSGCVNYHGDGYSRRQPVMISEGRWNYTAKMCTNPSPCKLGNRCRYCHSQEEFLYHPLVYKLSKCRFSSNVSGICSKRGIFCANYHGEDDSREVLSKETFDLVRYKTEQCKIRNCDGVYCFNYHSLTERRRNPQDFKYSPKPCINIYKGGIFQSLENCPKKDGCGFSHSKTEMQYHKDIFKSKDCKSINCSHPYCSFNHIDNSQTSYQETKKTYEEEKKARENLEFEPRKEANESTETMETKQSFEDKQVDESNVDFKEESSNNFLCKNCKEEEIEWVFECGGATCTKCLAKDCFKCKRAHIHRLGS